MLTIEQKKRIVEKRILVELTAYHAQYNAGMAMQILSCKYARASKDVGGLPDLISAMQASGLIRVEYTKNGARTVWPKIITIWY